MLPPRRWLSGVLFVAMLVSGTSAGAQVSQPRRPPQMSAITHEAPRAEIGIYAGLPNLMGGSVVGGRFAASIKPFAGVEVGGNVGRGMPEEGSFVEGYTAFRLQARIADTNRWLFVLAGVGSGIDTRYSVSPVIGAGIQFFAPGLPIGVRVDLVSFTAGESLRNRGRLNFGLTIGIR